MEIWKSIPNTDEQYSASSLGRIKSNKRGMLTKRGYLCKFKPCVLKPFLNRGYGIVGILILGVIRKKKVHRMVAEAFIPNPENKPHINHINGNPSDNRVENLEWCTRSENMQHANKLGLRKIPAGSKCHLSKLTEDKVKKIKILLSSGVKVSAIAKSHSVTGAAIYGIKNGRTWRGI